jgi:hypothetical protein
MPWAASAWSGLPVAGVGDHHLGRLLDAGGGHLAPGGLAHRLHSGVSMVSVSISAATITSDGQTHGMGVVASHPPARRLQRAGVRVAEVDLARRALADGVRA